MTSITRRDRATGTLVTIASAVEQGLEEDGGAWVIVCEAHGSILNCTTRSLAEATHALDFCDPCRDAQGAHDRTPGTVVREVPPVFYDDHIDRGCGESGRILSRTKHVLRVELDEAAFKDLLSAADYYVDMASELDPEYFGLVASARATLKRLKANPWNIQEVTS